MDLLIFFLFLVSALDPEEVECLKFGIERAFLTENTGVTAESVWGWCGTNCR